MLTFAYYLLKVSVCSGVLFSYYFFILRNKRFHQYNRFYLLGTVILSCIIPLAKLQFWNENVQQEFPAIRLLKVVANSDAFVEHSLKYGFFTWNFNSFALIIYTLISAAFFAWLIISIVRIGVLIYSNPNKSWNNINFIFTEVKGTPFSFFKYIFWNKNIDLQTEEGKHILQHEVTHVHENHSADKLFLQVVLIAGWLNPIFWIIRKELNMIHEFIADEKSVGDGDVNSFASMLLKTAYPQHSFTLTNSFFHSPIKRRLIMFTTSKKPSYSYLRRLMILPLLGFMIVFFSFKSKGQNSDALANSSVNVPTIKFENVVITNETSKSNVTSNKETDKTIKIKDANDADTSTLPKARVVLDGVQMSWEDFNKKAIASEQIKSMNVLKGKSATDKYGQKGANGVIEITTVSQGIVDKSIKEKAENTQQLQTSNSTSINASDTIEAKFPGGDMEWKKYLETNLNANVAAQDRAPTGDYTVKLEFIVTESGEVRDISATKVPEHCPSCAIEAVRAIKTGPKWDPMTIDGKKVTSKQFQFISFQVQEY